jgi:hypothetical protein
MTVQKSKLVDAIGVDNMTGFVTLFIFDDLEWEKEEEHLLLIQEKLNVYLHFIESGEVYNAYSQAANKDIEIKIHFKYQFPDSCIYFFEQVKEIIVDSGYHFNYKIGVA